jgi:hypothetical protein
MIASTKFLKKMHANKTLMTKGTKKTTCQYCRKLGHMEKACRQKTKDLEEKVKKLEGDVSTGRSTKHTSEGKQNNYMFVVSSSQALHAHTSQNEWIVNSGCTHHMAKDVSLFSSLSEATKKNLCS